MSNAGGVIEDGHDWARELVKKHAIVMHRESETVGTASDFFDGIERKFISPINGEPVVGPVLVLDNGNSFMALDERTFLELTTQQHRFYRTMQRVIAHALREAAGLLKSLGIPMDVGVSLLASTLKAQVAMLEAKPEIPPVTEPSPPKEDH